MLLEWIAPLIGVEPSKSTMLLEWTAPFVGVEPISGWGGGIRTSALRSKAACPTTRLLPSVNSIIMLSEIL